MNDFSEIERELKKLRPRDVSAELTARVASELSSAMRVGTPTAGVSVKRRARSWNWLPLGLGIAAAAAFLLLARVRVESPAQPARAVANTNSMVRSDEGGFLPAGVTQVVYSTRDEGLQFTPDTALPRRRVRSRQHETLRWKNPQTGASLAVSYPSEEVVLMPISAQ